MCGIIAVYNSILSEKDLREILLKLSVLLRHRGPDWSGIAISSDKKCGFTHERLSIVDPNGESQPFVNEKNILTVNGEIFNHKELKKKCNYQFQTESDCEVILPISSMYEEEKWLNMLDGQFAFAMLKIQKDESQIFIVARDPIGIVPLYYTKREDGSVWYASEMKVLVELNNIYKKRGLPISLIKIFEPGCYSINGEPHKRYFNHTWNSGKYIKNFNKNEIREKLEKSVIARLMTDVPFGVLLSGGLDSSIIASLVCKHSKNRIETCEKEEAHWPKIHTFSIGVKGFDSPDLKYAKQVADYLGTIHHEFTFSIEDGINALPEVIKRIETYDTTTIRASTPMFLLARKVKSMGIKMLLSGEGADELFGGYLYFHKAPNPEEFQEETIRKVERLHMYDCLRADKSTMSWGVEIRVPFLETNFVNFVMSIDPEEKMIKNGKMEKQILREAFDWGFFSGSYIPSSVLWRQKEQFSDGVGYSWIDNLKKHSESVISDLEMENVKEKYPLNTPRTKEEVMYRNIFVDIFGQDGDVELTVPWEDSIACSTATAFKWDKNWKGQADPSGRIENIHKG